MSEFSQSPQQRAFQCPECKGRIVIPAHLPSTTGPCPHCQATITSPEPDIYSSIIDVEPAPAAESKSAPVPVPAQTSVEKIAGNEVDQDAAESKAKAYKKSDTSTKRTSPVAVILVFILILAGLGGGGYFAIKMLKPKDDASNAPLMPTPRPTANPTLTKYLAASALDEKLSHINEADRLRPILEAFYKEGMRDEANTPANAFTPVKLPEMDSKKGFILFAYDQPIDPASKNPAGQRTKILAFLKETEAGVKLDWEVFAQTKYRTFNQFIKTPVIGKSEVFRVIASRSAVTNPNISYKLSDPAHLSDSVEISIDPKSQAGQVLANLNSGDANRTATIELTWTGDPNKPQLEIKRFICWEFLNLGGKEIAEVNPSN